jgi:ERCC4-type nuclease
MPRKEPNPLFPHTVLIDTREQLPYVFADITEDLETPDGQWRAPYLFADVPADKEHGGGVWRVNVERLTLPSGDYSLDGYATEVAVERKSICDLFGTVGQGRERFIRELERLNEMAFAAVVVEAEWSSIFNDPPRHTRLQPRTIYRSVRAWEQRYPRVHWVMCPGRDFAEVTTFRILERFIKEQAENSFRKPRNQS